MAPNELIINIRHYGWCGVSGATPDAHYVYAALGRYFSLCHLSKSIMENSTVVLVPPQFTKCKACVERIKTETEVITLSGNDPPPKG